MSLQFIELIVGGILPPFIDFVNRKISQSWLRYLISVLACLVIGAIVNYQNLNPSDVLASGAIIFGSAQSIYRLYWRGSDARVTIYGKSINR